MAIKMFKEGNYQEEIKSGITIVNFWATWCGPCQMFAPILEEVSSDYKVVKIDVDENKALAQELQISAVPTTIIYKDGEVKDTLMGFVPKEVLVGKLNAI